MKLVIPMAVFGSRMRPHTWTRPKPLLPLAGKPMLAHVLDRFRDMPIEEYVFIVGWLGEQVREYVMDNYQIPAHFVEQNELLGQAHALWLARKHTRAALSEIGHFFGRRSHSSVISAQKSVERWLRSQQRMTLSQRTCEVEEAIRKVEETLRRA